MLYNILKFTLLKYIPTYIGFSLVKAFSSLVRLKVDLLKRKRFQMVAFLPFYPFTHMITGKRSSQNVPPWATFSICCVSSFLFHLRQHFFKMLMFQSQKNTVYVSTRSPNRKTALLKYQLLGCFQTFAGLRAEIEKPCFRRFPAACRLGLNLSSIIADYSYDEPIKVLFVS